MQIALVLGLLSVFVILFMTEKFSVDLLTLMLLVALVVLGIVTPQEAFAGYASDIIIILGSIFVISGALQNTGFMDALGGLLNRLVAGSRNRLLLGVMSMVSFVSAFMNNTTVTAVFVPTIMGVARSAKVAASKLLMPVAFASILGGTCTLIGTSTNVAVSGFIAQRGMQPLGLFEVAPVGIIIVVIGLAYMVLFGQRLLPEHHDESLTEEYSMREYLCEIVVMPNSDLVGQRIFESDFSKMDFRILEVIRGERKFLPDSTTRIEQGDLLLVEGKIPELLKVKEAKGIDMKPELSLGDKDLQTENIRIAEVLVTAKSSLVGLTLKEADFRARYGLTALAIYRHGHSLRDKVGRIRLRVGDLLLVQGPADRFETFRRQPDLWILGEPSPIPYRRTKGLYTVGLFVLAITLGSFGVLPLSISFLTAAVLMVVSRCISLEEAYRFIDWRLLILIGGMTALGTAMDDQHSGAAGFVARGVVEVVGPIVSGMSFSAGTLLILGGFVLVTVALTQPMSNAAAALVVLPVALETAKELGANPRTFAIAIMLAASVSLITPLEPSCILVYGPGKYRFMDFVKAGLLLTLILVVVMLLVLPVFWPLAG